MKSSDVPLMMFHVPILGGGGSVDRIVVPNHSRPSCTVNVSIVEYYLLKYDASQFEVYRSFGASSVKFKQTIWSHIPKHNTLLCYRRENLKSHRCLNCFGKISQLKEG
jgi:hypothetical protein